MRLHIGSVGGQSLFFANPVPLAIEAGVHLAQKGGIVIGRAAQHDAVQPVSLGERRLQIRQTAVKVDRQVRLLRLQPLHQGIVERRNVPVLLRRQPLQPGLARMDDKG